MIAIKCSKVKTHLNHIKLRIHPLGVWRHSIGLSAHTMDVNIKTKYNIDFNKHLKSHTKPSFVSDL